MQIQDIPNACALDVLLAYEVFDSEVTSVMYPFNILRNMARLQARTPVIALVDGKEYAMIAFKFFFVGLARVCLCGHSFLFEGQTMGSR